MRSIVHLVSRHLYGISIPLSDWRRRGQARWVGVSDWPDLREFAAPRVRYINTQFDPNLLGNGSSPGAPRFLDVTNPSAEFLACADIITCSDVLEHVVPPVDKAFKGLYSMLVPGGALVLTVPYSLDEETVEHFPELNEYEIVERAGTKVLLNTTRDGRTQEFGDLIFHGGGDAVLEMRLFSLADVLRRLTEAGFEQTEVLEEDYPLFGIVQEPWGRPIVARRPVEL